MLKAVSHLTQLEVLVLGCCPEEDHLACGRELTPQQLHQLVPVLRQLGGLQRLRDLRLSSPRGVADEWDRQAVLASLTGLETLHV